MISFKLANASDMGVREGANSSLAVLPTHPKLLADFQRLHHRSKVEAQKPLEAHFNAKSHLLYTLQILDGIVNHVNCFVAQIPANQSVVTCKHRTLVTRLASKEALDLLIGRGRSPQAHLAEIPNERPTLR
jgi:hypothetical protein